jgi:hypothetical protein
MPLFCAIVFLILISCYINGLLCAFWQPLEEHVKVKLAQFCHVPVKMLPAQEWVLGLMGCVLLMASD